MRHYLLAATAAISLLSLPAHAALLHDQTLPSEIIHGDGNIDGGFTVDERNGIIVGLRATVRYDPSDNQPKPLFHSNSDGTFSHPSGAPPGNTDRARWNFTWSVDTTETMKTLDQFSYLIGFDTDPGTGATYFTFDPLDVPDPRNLSVMFWDHGIGTRATGNGDGDDDARSALNYGTLLSQNTVAQNSWNFAFFDSLWAEGFDPNVDGNYDVFFAVYNEAGGTLLARSDIRVCVGTGVACDPIPTPEPASLALLGLGLGALPFVRRRRRTT